jgi:Mrp family chromosome partitioning ATPase/capsular polysaccharide biosynthesis protein
LPDQLPVEPQELHARDYLRPVLTRKWIVLLIVLLATGGTYAFYSREPPVYEASTKIFVGNSSGPVEGAAPSISDRTIQNQATLLKSREVAVAVADRLGRRSEATKLAASVAAQPSSGSDFVLITAHRPTARDAALVANAFAQAFVDIRSRAQRAEITKAIRETRAQLDSLPARQRNDADRAALRETIRRLQLSLAVPPGSAKQVDPALAPASPIAPRPKRNALFALVLSLIAAIALAFGLERFDRRLRRIEDVEPLYRLPLLAVLPHSEDVALRIDSQAALSPPFKESFRQLRANIQLAAISRPLKRILVTSAISGEGKSIVVRNLAIAFRESGLRVAVVDADLRRPALARLFSEEPPHGLTDVLTGGQSLGEALVTVPVHARGLGTLAQIQALPTPATNGAPGDAAKSEVISLLAAGPQPANPPAVLATERTRLVLNEVADQHDIVLIDSPPLLAVSDAVSLAPEVDAVIVVARLGLTTRDTARNAAELLARIPGAQPIGAIINDVSKFEGYGYGYGYGYGSEPT